MKYLYDRERDALTIFFADKKAVDTREMWPNVIVDIDARGLPISIEFLDNASEAVDVKGLSNLRMVRIATPAEFPDAEKITGDSVRARREAMGLTQAELGELLSVTPNSIARWERGEANIEHPSMLLRAMEALANSRTTKRRPIAKSRHETTRLQKPALMEKRVSGNVSTQKRPHRATARDHQNASASGTPGSGRKRR